MKICIYIINMKIRVVSGAEIRKRWSGIRKGYTGEFDYFCKLLIIKLSSGYACAIIIPLQKKSYMKLTIFPKIKIYIVRKQVSA